MPHTLQIGAFISDLMAFGASELVCKATRLLVVIAISRHLSVESVGYAAAALSLGEIIKALTENGVAQQIIRASAEKRDGRCRTAHGLFWNICMTLCFLQVLMGGTLCWLGHDILGLLLAALALEYLFMPAGLVHAALAMREGKLKQVAAISGGQIACANLLTVALVLVWASPFVLIAPRLLTAPMWLIAMRRLRPWRPNRAAPPAKAAEFLSFGVSVTGVELVKALRLHADKMVVGLLLGPEILGLYFMAFNAGLSLATSLCAALNIVLFPHLSITENTHTAMRRAFLSVLFFLSPIVAMQAYFAPLYVPRLLGADWTEIVPAVSILCFAALPLAGWSVVAAHLRVTGRPQAELGVTLFLLTALTLGTVLTAPYGLSAMAFGYVTITTVLLAATCLFYICQSADFSQVIFSTRKV